MSLSVRSAEMLVFFQEHGTDIGIQTVTALYSHVLKVGCIFPGLSSPRARQAHTTEQKVWSLGMPIDNFIVPYLQDPQCFDRFDLNADAEFIFGDVAGCKYLQGALVKPHFEAYCIFPGLMADAEEPEQHPDSRNSAKFLAMVPGEHTWSTVVKAIRP